MTIGAANGTVSWPTIGPAGTYLVTIRATNSTGSDDESWVLTVIGGDVNCDGQSNGDDIAAFNACFLLGPAIAPGCSGADLDGDGDVDAQDLSLFVALLLAP